jgi:hypothetical protein
VLVVQLLQAVVKLEIVVLIQSFLLLLLQEVVEEVVLVMMVLLEVQEEVQVGKVLMQVQAQQVKVMMVDQVHKMMKQKILEVVVVEHQLLVVMEQTL